MGKACWTRRRQQNWDPSIQALVAFPDVLARLNQDIRWTTDLGNAFLAQQADVMNAVQQLRAKAQANGKLKSTPQENVDNPTAERPNRDSTSCLRNRAWSTFPTIIPNGSGVRRIYGYYPPLLYPGLDVGFSFFPGIDLGLYFGGGWGLWGGFGWGWGPNWFGGRIMLNDNFFHRYGFNDYHPGLGRRLGA